MHLLVDGVCAATLFGCCAAVPEFTQLVLLYNTLAFSTQCLVGLLTDRCRAYHFLTALSAVPVSLGFLLPLPPLLRVIFVGLGNSLFHVSGGTETLLASGKKAWPLGMFVAPGAVGLALGRLFPAAGTYFAAALLLCAVCLVFLKKREYPKAADAVPAGRNYAVAAVLLLAVAVRAFGGTAVPAPWNAGTAAAILLSVTVCAGKMAGGFVFDRLGAEKTALLSVIPAALLIVFCTGSMAFSLAGQLLLNLTMPVTLCLLYRLLPDSPGFAFGLAASALWPGTLAGQMLIARGETAKALPLACFALGLAAILLGAKYLKKDKVTK